MQTTALLLLLFYYATCHRALSTNDPCKCPTQIFEVYEMKGTMKFEQRKDCNQTITCLVYIKPLAGHVVSVENRIPWDGSTSGRFSLFYYRGEKNEMGMIPTQESHIISHYGKKYQSQISSTPAGVGLYVNYTRAADRKGLDFTYTYERIPAADMKTICPPLVVNANSTKQVIKMGNWPPDGCTIRVYSCREPTFTMYKNCGLSRYSEYSYVWKGKTLYPEEEGFLKLLQYDKRWFRFYSGTDIHYKVFYPEDEDYENCELTFFTVSYTQRVVRKFFD